MNIAELLNNTNVVTAVRVTTGRDKNTGEHKVYLYYKLPEYKNPRVVMEDIITMLNDEPDKVSHQQWNDWDFWKIIDSIHYDWDNGIRISALINNEWKDEGDYIVSEIKEELLKRMEE